MVYRRVGDRSALDWALAMGLVGAVLFIGYAGLSSMNKAQVQAKVEKPVVPESAGLPPEDYRFEVPNGRSPHEPAPRAAGVTVIYECMVDGQKLLSDRDCGPGALQREVDASDLNTYREGPIPYVDMRRYEAPPREASGAAPTLAPARSQSLEAKKALCDQIQARIDWINARMRQGYTSQGGEYWRALWHDAKNDYYDAGCGKAK